VKFSFRLQTLLNWKKNLEESAQMELGRKVRQFERQEDEIRRLTHERFSVAQELKEKSHKGIQLGEYLTYKEFGERSYHNLLEKESKKKEMMRELEEERQRLIGLIRERKMLGKLREKSFRKFIHQLEKSDQEKIDELVLRGYSNNRKLIRSTAPNPDF